MQTRRVAATGLLFLEARTTGSGRRKARWRNANDKRNRRQSGRTEYACGARPRVILGILLKREDTLGVETHDRCPCGSDAVAGEEEAR